MTNLIQGSDAVLSFYKDAFVPMVCSTDISLAITADNVPTRTKGGGNWKSFNYQALSYAVTLSGLLKFDEANWTGWDMLNNQVGFSQVIFQITFTDDGGNVRSIRGTAIIKTNTTTINISAIVKQDFELTGSGSLMIFDGIIPCDATIQTITVTGQLASDGTVHMAYTYTGTPYQIKYRIDGQGNYVYAAADFIIDVPGLSVGSHSVEIIPVCLNNYEGVGLIQSFVVTQSMTCSSVITGITISSIPYSASNTFTGAATQMKYRVDGGPWIYVSISTLVSLRSMSIGSHSIEEVPICANGVEGKGFVKSFSIFSQPAQSMLNYSFSSLAGAGQQFQIFVNGVLVVSSNSNAASGSITAPTGQQVKVTIGLGSLPHNVHLDVQDTTTSTVLYSTTSAIANSALQFIWNGNGDTYSVNASIF